MDGYTMPSVRYPRVRVTAGFSGRARALIQRFEKQDPLLTTSIREIYQPLKQRIEGGKGQRLEMLVEALIPMPADQNLCAQSRSPMDMIVHG